MRVKIERKEKEMKTRNCGIFAGLTAALLITALVIGCVAPTDPSALAKTRDPGPPQQGKVICGLF